MAELVGQSQRAFALDVVRKLRESQFQAYWAGGCVRDQLLGRSPKDYDVATDAPPDAIRRVFGHRRTLAIGAAFGVITVLGPKNAGQIEVATFRRDVAYSDGRHPEQVVFSSPEEDAQRRDFTINGLFYDPLENRVLDFVGGQDDLQRRVIRAIGRAEERFEEDKLRMLRAVRFAATFDFQLEAGTLQAVQRMAREVLVVSAERIAQEMRRMLQEPGRAQAVQLLVESRLAAVILPEIVPPDGGPRLERARDVLSRLVEPSFPLALAALLGTFVDVPGVVQIGYRWRLSNKEIERAAWLIANRRALCDASRRPWSQLQPILVAPGAAELLALAEAEMATTGCDPQELAWCRARLAEPRAVLDPSPLLTGNDLLRHGVPSGPRFRKLLESVRDAQLDGQVRTPHEALQLVDRLIAEGSGVG